MKKYTLLWHIFELEPRAYDFLASYIQRIDDYAALHHIAPDILEDIKYSIIEKLYAASTPISESFVMSISQIIGEPEAIFETKSDTEQVDPQPKNLLEKWLWKEKPMVWGVAYWISKSLKMPVSVVRLILLWSVFLYGTSIWLYPLLAIFVPFQDKKATTGQTGNIFFEIIRVLIWLGVIFFLASSLFGSLVGVTIFSFLPNLSGQSLQALVPSFIIPVVILSFISLIILLIGSIGALIKRSRVSKNLVIIAITIIVGSIFASVTSGVSLISNYNHNQKTLDKQILATWSLSEDSLVINLKSDSSQSVQWNYYPRMLQNEFEREIGRFPTFQDIQLLPSPDDEVRVELVDSVNILPRSDTEGILAKRANLTTSLSGNILDITIPHDIFSQKVPFSFAERTLNIYVPSDKKIIYNNNSELRYSTPRRWQEIREDKEFMIYCTDTFSFLFHKPSSSWRCADTTFSEVNKYANDLSDYDGRSPDEFDEQTIERIFVWLALWQAQAIAQGKDRTLRVIEQDGIELPVDNDYRPGRINLEIKNNIITDVEIE